MKAPRLLVCTAMLLMATTASSRHPALHAQEQHRTRTRVVLLGTGTPVPDPERSGPATAIIVDDSAYLVDVGPGVVRRAKAAVLDRHIDALDPGHLTIAFITHLHSDHTAGYSDLIFTGWTAGRRATLEVYGPAGLRSMTEHLLQAYRIDIATRTNPEGDQRGNPDGWKVNAHEIKAGVVYRDARVIVTAFPTRHALESYGYRFDTPDRSVVISGDTSPTEETIDACHGCDILIHEARALEMFARLPEDRRSFGAKNHTTSEQLAALATRAKPGLLIVYHAWVSWWPNAEANQSPGLTSGALHSTPDVLQQEIGSRYSGHFVIGRDLDVY